MKGRNTIIGQLQTFIESEIKNPLLLTLAKKIPDAEKIYVGLYRDAWQYSARPAIDERNINGSGTLLSKID